MERGRRPVEMYKEAAAQDAKRATKTKERESSKKFGILAAVPLLLAGGGILARSEMESNRLEAALDAAHVTIEKGDSFKYMLPTAEKTLELKQDLEQSGHKVDGITVSYSMKVENGIPNSFEVDSHNASNYKVELNVDAVIDGKPVHKSYVHEDVGWMGKAGNDLATGFHDVMKDLSGSAL